MKRIQKLLSFLLCFVMILPVVACSNPGDDTCEHKTVKRAGTVATCTAGGKLTHYECLICKKVFADKACTTELKSYEINLGKLPHDLTHTPAVEATKEQDGNREYWTCGLCGGYFSDSLGKNEISEDELSIGAYGEYIDFVVSVESGRDPVILQFADPQIMDSSTARNVTLDERAVAFWNEDSRDELAYDLMTEIVEATDPDLILVSGDVIYGRYDYDRYEGGVCVSEEGHLHTEFIAFMESFNIPWAPIMGNHDLETPKGADWVSDRYEEAPNCLFKQNTLSGHGNYTIGIEQDDEIKRVIFNMDTNGCSGASDATLASPQTIRPGTDNSWGTYEALYGLQKDQIAWFENAANGIKAAFPNTKLSVHIHVPMNYVYTAMNEAYKAKVGSPVAKREIASGYEETGKFLAPQRIIGHTEGDFGILCSMYAPEVVDCWDTVKTNGADDVIHNGMVALGVDSFFLGHMHSNSASIVYNGVRYQFGQKCSLYDDTQYINNTTGKVTVQKAYVEEANVTKLVGGTVTKLDSTGAIVDAYIEYNTGHGKEINWNQWKNSIA